MAYKMIRDMAWLEARSESQPSGCWHWTKFTNKKSGYGYASVDGVPTPAHRISFMIANGRWPEVCRHRCDNRICVNPDHLEDGTTADNSRDYAQRGVAHKGDNHEGSKMSNAQARQVYDLAHWGMVHSEIAKAYGIHQSTVSRIKHKKRWKIALKS